MKKLMIIALILFIGSGCQKDEQTLPKEITELPEYIQDPSDIVDMHGDIRNLEKFYEFIDHVEQGKKDVIRIVNYTEEGAPMLHDLKFVGKVIQSTYDSIRDGYGPGSIEEASCSGIAVMKTDKRTDYTLEECSNQEEKERTILVIEELY